MNENQNFSSEQEKEQQAEHFFVQKGIAVESAPRVRRVGSFTMGIALIVCGIVAILGLFRTDFDLILIAKFAPIVLILLGLEILVSSILFKRDKLKYDILSGFFCFLLICGSKMRGNQVRSLSDPVTVYGERRSGYHCILDVRR